MDNRSMKRLIDQERSENLELYELSNIVERYTLQNVIRLKDESHFIEALVYCKKEFGGFNAPLTPNDCRKRWTFVRSDGIAEFYFLSKGDAFKFKLMGF